MFYRAIRFLCYLFCRVAFRLKIEGQENIPAEGAALLAVNHRSNFDPVLAGIGSKRSMNFMAKAELFKFKPFGALIKRLGAFPISRGKGDIAAVKGAFAILKAEKMLLMFPQGKRIKDGSRGKLKTGVTVIANKMCVPIIPACISGNYKFRSRMTVRFGKPIVFDGKKLDEEETMKLTELVYDRIFELEEK